MRKVVEVRVCLSALVNFAVVLGFTLERRRKCGRVIFCLVVNKVVWWISIHRARWSPGESVKEEYPAAVILKPGET